MQDTKTLKIMLTGGGSGGHLFPLVAVSRAIRKIREGELLPTEFYFVGPNTFTDQILYNEKITIYSVVSSKLRRYFSFITILDVLKLPITAIQSFFRVYILMPDVIFSKGGYGSFFPVLAGWIYRIPIVIHESDSSMGLGNKILSVLANHIILSFPLKEDSSQLGKKKMILGNPIREELFGTNPDFARRMLGLSPNRPVILIQGGSQGSQLINLLTIKELPSLLAQFEVIHQMGKSNLKRIEQPYYHPFEFLNEEELAAAYAACSVIVSRAGSGNIYEIAAAGKPSILIPLPSARGDHQRKNAYLYTETGASLVLEEPNLTPHLFVQQIISLVKNTEKMAKMAKNTKIFARPNAAFDIAKVVLGVLH